MKKTVLSSLMMFALLNAAAYAETLPSKSPAPNAAKTSSARHHAAAQSVSHTHSASHAAPQTVTLQMGAFTDPNLAYKQAAKASLLGLPARVVQMKNSNGDIVRVVRSSSRLKQVDAERVAADLREQQVNVLLMQ